MSKEREALQKIFRICDAKLNKETSHIWVIAYSALQSESEWISVEDDKPIVDKDLLIWDGFARIRGFMDKDGFFHSNDYKSIDISITHWMYLPNPPSIKTPKI